MIIPGVVQRTAESQYFSYCLKSLCMINIGVHALHIESDKHILISDDQICYCAHEIVIFYGSSRWSSRPFFYLLLQSDTIGLSGDILPDTVQLLADLWIFGSK